MMSEAAPKDNKSLHNLLEGLLKSQKRDIKAYASGHLNENKLYKAPGTHGRFVSWKSADKSIPLLQPKSKIPRPVKETDADHKMKESLASFALGTSGMLPMKPIDTKPPARLGSRGPVTVPRSSPAASVGSYGRKDDGVLVEELKLGDPVLERSPRKTPMWAEQDMLEDGYAKPPVQQSVIRDMNLVHMKNTLLPNHLAGITKKDQYDKLKGFESGVLKKHETMEQNVLSGVKAVEHLEEKLQRDLDKLEYNGYGPNFHRLQIYSDTFDDLIRDSTTFKFILGIVKKEYDDYIASLLDNQPAKHKALYDQVESMSTRAGANPRLLQQEVQKVEELEKEAKHKLAENERLRKEVSEEIELASRPTPESSQGGKSAGGGGVIFSSRGPELELTDQIEEVHATILEKLDELNDLRGKLRNEYVPSTVCSHLEQCIKDSEVEIQKLTSQKEFFDRSTAEMERDLKEAIENADTTEKDAKRLWKKINAVKKSHDKQGVLHTPSEDTEDSEEEDDKWNWYIS